MKKLLLCASVLTAFALSTGAKADGVKVGTLTCNEASGWGFVFGSSHAIRCTFAGAGGVDQYEGSISKFGVDVGYQKSAVIVWTVVAPTDHLASGSLEGHYGGATASAAVGVGVGANALVGGSNNSIALQPFSIEGATGLNVAAGIGELTLHHH